VQIVLSTAAINTTIISNYFGDEILLIDASTVEVSNSIDIPDTHLTVR
jgi:hypothetical protein